MLMSFLVPANFFARCVKILLTSDHPIFPRVVSFFYSKFTFKMNIIPEFINMVMSSSTTNGLQERYWMMELVAESLLNQEDYKILESMYGFLICPIFKFTLSETEQA